MAETDNRPAAVNYFLEPGFVFLSTQPAVISTVVGSGVAVCLYDQRRKVGGMAHYPLPLTRNRNEATARFGNVAVRVLIRMMLDGGSKPKHLEAQIFGGAHNREVSPKNIGPDNIRIARTILARERIPVVSEDVGGEKGRKIVFNTDANEIAVLKPSRIRSADWYPYEGRRQA